MIDESWSAFSLSRTGMYFETPGMSLAFGATETLVAHQVREQSVAQGITSSRTTETTTAGIPR